MVLSTRERKKEICPHIKVARNTVLLCLLLHKMLVFCPFKRLINSSKKQSHLFAQKTLCSYASVELTSMEIRYNVSVSQSGFGRIKVIT